MLWGDSEMCPAFTTQTASRACTSLSAVVGAIPSLVT